ncbi:MAG: long-chain fatty acid--CoA ligase [Chloroflexi bacterium]|nr:MAG: long-chain fatty acid--CoA ligase [Chloroflexota bacterium]
MWHSRRPMATQMAPHGRPAPAAGATVVEAFHRQVATRGTAKALYFKAGDRYQGISWAEFGLAARRWSAYLLSQGVAEQEHVAIWAGNRPEWHISDIGILSVRARPVPIYLTLSADQARYVLGHSESKVVLVGNTTIRDKVLEVRDHLPALRRVVVMEGQDKPSDDGFVVSWQQALDTGDAALIEHGDHIDRRAASVSLDDVATLIYTSGTTGPPKAVLLTHANVMAAIHALEEFMTATPDDRFVSHLPLAHIAERLSSELRSYAFGCSVYFVDNIASLGASLRAVRPTAFFTVPRVWEKMADQVRKGVDELPPPRRRLAHWALRTAARAQVTGTQSFSARLADRLVLAKLRAHLGLDQATILASGAAPIAPEVLRFFASLGLEVLEVYGQTEGTGLTTMNRPAHARIGTVGQALRGNEIRIADDGEILVRGGVVFNAYYKEPDATAEALHGGWLHTGDVGELDADGYLRITDRKKDLIITGGGKNISPSNIERALQRQRLVAHAVVIGDRRPFVSALVTLDPEEAAEFAHEHRLSDDIETLARDPTVRGEIDRHVQEVNHRLSNVEQVKKWTLLPKDFTVGDELTPTLKVKRKVVAEKYAALIDGLYEK